MFMGMGMEKFCGGIFFFFFFFVLEMDFFFFLEHGENFVGHWRILDMENFWT